MTEQTASHSSSYRSHVDDDHVKRNSRALTLRVTFFCIPPLPPHCLHEKMTVNDVMSSFFLSVCPEPNKSSRHPPSVAPSVQRALFLIVGTVITVLQRLALWSSHWFPHCCGLRVLSPPPGPSFHTPTSCAPGWWAPLNEMVVFPLCALAINSTKSLELGSFAATVRLQDSLIEAKMIGWIHMA